MAEKPLGTVRSLTRYPVKSVLGESCDRVRADERGFELDRALAIYGSDGKIASGKTTRRFRRMPRLFQMRSWVEDGTVYISTGSSRKHAADDPAGWIAVSEMVGEPVDIRAEDGVAHKDAAPVHLITTASLRWAGGLRPGFDGAPERFRANAVIDVEGTGRVEDAWVGRRLQIGTCLLRVTKSVERCVMPTLPQTGLPFLPGLLKALTEESDACLGVYAEVEQAGELSVGDAVSFATQVRTLRNPSRG